MTVRVLNATYEHISHTRVSRAVALVLRGDGVIEEAVEGRVIRHQHGELPYPRVIRLLRYVKLTMERRPIAWSKSGVLKRDDHKCGYCGKHATTIDHVVPQSRAGGKRDWLNTVASCERCNARKANRTPREAHMTLLITPTVPMRTHVRASFERPRRGVA